MTQLLDLGVVPIINENDAVSANGGYQVHGLYPQPLQHSIPKPQPLAPTLLKSPIVPGLRERVQRQRQPGVACRGGDGRRRVPAAD
jgi:hypothetical protein